MHTFFNVKAETTNALLWMLLLLLVLSLNLQTTVSMLRSVVVLMRFTKLHMHMHVRTAPVSVCACPYRLALARIQSAQHSNFNRWRLKRYDSWWLVESIVRASRKSCLMNSSLLFHSRLVPSNFSLFGEWLLTLFKQRSMNVASFCPRQIRRLFMIPCDLIGYSTSRRNWSNAQFCDRVTKRQAHTFSYR